MDWIMLSEYRRTRAHGLSLNLQTQRKLMVTYSWMVIVLGITSRSWRRQASKRVRLNATAIVIAWAFRGPKSTEADASPNRRPAKIRKCGTTFGPFIQRLGNGRNVDTQPQQPRPPPRQQPRPAQSFTRSAQRGEIHTTRQLSLATSLISWG